MQRQITRLMVSVFNGSVSLTLSDIWPRFQGVTIHALNVLCAQLMRDLFAIGEFLPKSKYESVNEKIQILTDSSVGCNLLAVSCCRRRTLSLLVSSSAV